MASENKVDLALKMLSAPVTEMSTEQIAAELDSWLADDFELHYPGSPPIPYAGVWRGRQGFQDFMAKFNSLVETLSMSDEGIQGAGDTVFITGSTNGRVRGSGAEFTSRWILVWTFNGDKVTRMVEYHDTQAIAAAFS